MANKMKKRFNCWKPEDRGDPPFILRGAGREVLLHRR